MLVESSRRQPERQCDASVSSLVTCHLFEIMEWWQNQSPPKSASTPPLGTQQTLFSVQPCFVCLLRFPAFDFGVTVVFLILCPFLSSSSALPWFERSGSLDGRNDRQAGPGFLTVSVLWGHSRELCERPVAIVLGDQCLVHPRLCTRDCSGWLFWLAPCVTDGSLPARFAYPHFTGVAMVLMEWPKRSWLNFWHLRTFGGRSGDTGCPARP